MCTMCLRRTNRRQHVEVSHRLRRGPETRELAEVCVVVGAVGRVRPYCQRIGRDPELLGIRQGAG